MASISGEEEDQRKELSEENLDPYFPASSSSSSSPSRGCCCRWPPAIEARNRVRDVLSSHFSITGIIVPDYYHYNSAACAATADVVLPT